MVSGAQLLGPIARRLICPDRWTDQYPAWPAWAKELDELLLFAEEQGRLADFVPRIEGRNTQRHAALNELRTAYWFHHNGFPIVQWEPLGLTTRVGEFLVGTAEGNVFAEVKSPGWESELSDEQLHAGRAKLPKYIEGEGGGAFGNWQAVQRCLASAKTYPKFDPKQPNLLIIADNLRVSLHDSLRHVEIALYAEHKGYGEFGYFTSSRFENLGGVGVFDASSPAFSGSDGIHYAFQIFDNPHVLPSAKLPNSILKFKSRATGIVRSTFVQQPA